MLSIFFHAIHSDEHHMVLVARTKLTLLSFEQYSTMMTLYSGVEDALQHRIYKAIIS